MDHESWKVTRVGAEESATSKVFDQGQNKATTSVNKHGNFRFKGIAIKSLAKAYATLLKPLQHLDQSCCCVCTWASLHWTQIHAACTAQQAFSKQTGLYKYQSILVIQIYDFLWLLAACIAFIGLLFLLGVLLNF